MQKLVYRPLSVRYGFCLRIIILLTNLVDYKLAWFVTSEVLIGYKSEVLML